MRKANNWKGAALAIFICIGAGTVILFGPAQMDRNGLPLRAILSTMCYVFGIAFVLLALGWLPEGRVNRDNGGRKKPGGS